MNLCFLYIRIKLGKQKKKKLKKIRIKMLIKSEKNSEKNQKHKITWACSASFCFSTLEAIFELKFLQLVGVNVWFLLKGVGRCIPVSLLFSKLFVFTTWTIAGLFPVLASLFELSSWFCCFWEWLFGGWLELL